MNQSSTRLANRHSLLLLNILIIVTLGTLFLAYSSWASSNQEELPTDSHSSVISYQGTLTNELGQPINEAQPMTFRIYDSSQADAALWTETYSITHPVQVQNGQFQVWLGSLTPFPPSLWSNPALYLGIQIGDDQELSPRERIGTAPFAMQAGAAATVADRAIGSAHLALQQAHRTLQSDVEISATASITEGVGVEIPGTELLVEVARTSRILYTAQAIASFSQPEALNTIQVVMDGAPVHLYQSLGQRLETINILSYINLEAGAHRITLHYLPSIADSEIRVDPRANTGFVAYVVIDQE